MHGDQPAPGDGGVVLHPGRGARHRPWVLPERKRPGITPRVPGAVLTEASDVNDTHVVVGQYVDAQGGGHGFRWTRSTGRYDYPLDAPFPGAVHTAIFGINNAGDLAGTYQAPAGATHGFVVSKGHWRSLDAPGAQVTVGTAITEDGAVLGIGDGDRRGIRTFCSPPRRFSP